jgi:hypothetical protein
VEACDTRHGGHPDSSHFLGNLMVPGCFASFTREAGSTRFSDIRAGWRSKDFFDRRRIAAQL